MLKDHQDAYGHSLYDCLKGKADTQIVERDDSCIESDGLKGYFNTYRDWHPIEKKAMRFVRGRVLDIGCGVGRIAIPLTGYLGGGGQYDGFDVVPGGIAWCEKNISIPFPHFRFELADIYFNLV